MTRDLTPAEATALARTLVRSDPCTNLSCRAMNFRLADTPAPSRCPRCGGDTLLRPLRLPTDVPFVGESWQ